MSWSRGAGAAAAAEPFAVEKLPMTRHLPRLGAPRVPPTPRRATRGLGARGRRRALGGLGRLRFALPWCAVVSLWAAGTAPAGAQTGGDQVVLEGLANLIPSLFDRTVVLFPAGHEAHFADSSQDLREAGIQINRSMVGQLSTFPLGTSSGGFSYSFDEQLGIFERTSESFGSVFAERAETIGNGKWNFGLNLFAVQYDAIDDLDLRDGDVRFSLTHLDTNDDGTTVETFFEGDLVNVFAALDLSTETVVFFGNYGVTDRFDVAVAVPVVRVELDAQLTAHIERLASEGFSDPPFHRFPDGSDTLSVFAGDAASGLGDILVRAKLNVARNENAAFAVATDVRLPTGDEDDLLGTGATQTRLFAIGSAQLGKFVPHVNAGYTFSSGGSELVGDLPDEIGFTLGFSAAVHPRVTLFSDVVWRTLFDASQLAVGTTSHLLRRHDSAQIERFERPVLRAEQDDINLILGSLGLKVNLTGELLFTVNLALSLGDEGLRDEDIVPLVGIDYSF